MYKRPEHGNRIHRSNLPKSPNLPSYLKMSLGIPQHHLRMVHTDPLTMCFPSNSQPLSGADQNLIVMLHHLSLTGGCKSFRRQLSDSRENALHVLWVNKLRTQKGTKRALPRIGLGEAVGAKKWEGQMRVKQLD